jgi:chorismate--pyruvate lyase
MKAWSNRNVQRGNRKHWVGAAGSLSARLAGAGQRFSVQVLSQGLQKLYPDEASALGLGRVKAGYVREVMLRVDEAAVVFARSVTTHPHSQGPWRSIRGLGTRPLADVLFGQHGIARTPLQFACLQPAGPLHRHVAHAWLGAAGVALASRALPARRSVFTRGAAPLLVTEVFAAPDAPWSWLTTKTRRGSPALPRTKP